MSDKTERESRPIRRRSIPKGANRMPDESSFYNRIVPVVLALLGLLMVILIVIAAGVLLGFVAF
jgi:hypothetical protein